jgi:threonine/homoserine/homoserine lactone efflux protein
MGNVIGDILPLALGITISPLPIIAAILMLLSPRARVTSVGFLLGWVVGIIAAVTIFTLLSSSLPDSEEGASKPIAGTVMVVLGALLLFLAVKQWRGRPVPGSDPALPPWMQAIDRFTFPKAAGLGFLLSALNPKNLIMGAGAGVVIGSAGLDTAAVVGAIAAFTVIAGASVAIPVVGFLLASEKLRGPLDSLRGWLEKENAVIMAVLLLVIGVVMIGKGIGNF